MGSEGPPQAITINITGFQKFHGVPENPTETIVKNIKDYVNKRGLPKGLTLGSCSILPTAGEDALATLYETLRSAVTEKDSPSSQSGRIVWVELSFFEDYLTVQRQMFLCAMSMNSDVFSDSDEDRLMVHFGVNSGATKFAIEQQAVNEASFRCPDEMGWKPQKAPIIQADGGISRIRETPLPVDEISKALSMKGFDVMISDDAGRFVCNYVYYHSLSFAEQSGIKSLFVHVPLFSTIDEETQMQFAASLLDVLASLC